MKKEPLFVPITLNVLLLGKPEIEKSMADIAPDYRFIDEDNVFASEIISAPFDTRAERGGAHLHWLMPDALLQGEQGKDGSLSFQELPNRWLVFRLHAKADKIERKLWLVQSDAITSTGKTAQGMTKTTLPWLVLDEAEGIWKPGGRDNRCYMYVGDAKPDTEEWTEPERVLEHLDAGSAGDIRFTAMYPLCRTVFGFYDNMEDTEPGSYTYLVCGYYSKAHSDCIYHGMSKGVQWEGMNHCYSKEQAARHFNLVMGNTSAETLACYMQQQLPEIQGLERMMNILLEGGLSDFDNENLADTLIHAEERLHNRQFSYTDAGYDWQIADAQEIFLEKEEYKAVCDLKELQSSLNDTMECIEDYGEQVYLYWYQYVSRGASDKKLRKQLTETLDKLDAAKEKKKQLIDRLEKEGKYAKSLMDKKGFRMKEVPKQSYALPVPPVVLFTQKDMGRTYQHGFQSEAGGELPCRRKGVHALTVEIDGKTVEITAEDIQCIYTETLHTPEPAFEELCGEAVLLNEDFAGTMADILLKKENIQNTEENREKVIEEIKAAQKTVEGRPFHIAEQQWEMPWHPMMMSWKTELTPARTSLEQDDSWKAFTLGDIDLEEKTEYFQGKPITLSGQTILTPHAAENMQNMILKLIEDYGEAGGDYTELTRLVGELKNRQILSQQLEGFQEALLGLKPSPMLPIMASRMQKYKKEERALARRAAESIQGIYPCIPPAGDKNRFLPIRAGSMRLTAFRLIDTFGQWNDMAISKNHLQIAESMRCSLEGAALLPPRLPRPARLSLQWLDGETDGAALDEKSSPVCGFLLLNQIEKSLQLYDKKGLFLGWIRRAGSKAEFYSAPGKETAVADIPGRQLRAFTEGCLSWKGDELEEFFKKAEEHFEQHGGLQKGSAGMQAEGNILALVRGRIAIREKGDHESYWKAAGGRTNGYETSEFTVRVADTRRMSNGLAGYFLDTREGCDYSRCYFCSDDTRLSMSIKDNERTMTFLMDPYGDITLRTGFLPAVTKGLPAVLFEKQMENMELICNLGPVLSPVSEILLPMDNIAQHPLIFTEVEKDKETCSDSQIKVWGEGIQTEQVMIKEGYMTIRKKPDKDK